MHTKQKPAIPARPRISNIGRKTQIFDTVKVEGAAAVAGRATVDSKTESEDKAKTRNADETDITIERFLKSEKEHSAVNGSLEDLIDFNTEGFHYHGNDVFQPDQPLAVAKTLEELFSVEELYIKRLKNIIDNYMSVSRPMVDPFLKTVFGNIEAIQQFHEYSFYPDLKECSKDLSIVMECFSTHIAAGHFYNYVVYAMNNTRSDEELDKPMSKQFFEKRRNHIGDQIGLRDQLRDPLKHIFHYQNLIESLLKKVTKNNQLNFEVAAISKALYDVQKLLNVANKSVTVAEIVDSKINLLNQGNFLTHNEVNIYDHNYKRKYKGIIFVFQRCVVCTEMLSSKLQFKAYFPNGTSCTELIEENKFLLYERNNYKIEISGGTNVIQQMRTQIWEVLSGNRENRYSNQSSSSLTSIRSEERFERSSRSSREASSISDSVDNRTISYSDRSSSETATTSLIAIIFQRSVMKGHKSLNNQNKNLERGGGYGSYENEINQYPSSPIPHELINTFTAFATQQTSDEIIHEMLTNESDYVRQLTIGIHTYLTYDYGSITETAKGDIIKIFGNIQQIRNFHERTLHMTLSQCGNDVIKIANVFINYTQEGLFCNYLVYAANYGNTQPLRNMKPYRDMFEFRRKNAVNSQEVEYYLCLPLQHVNKYRLFMERIINTLNIDNDAVAIGSCSKAIKTVERLRTDVDNSSTTLNNQTRKRGLRKMSNLFLN